jgi:hypothetical protein
MPRPLRIDPASVNHKGIWKILTQLPVWILVPMFLFLLQTSLRGRNIFDGSVDARLLMRGAIIVLPAIAGVLMFIKPSLYIVEDDEVLIRRTDTLKSFLQSGWMMAALLPPLIFGLLVSVFCSHHAIEAGRSNLIPATQGLFTFLISAVLGIFYSAMFWTVDEIRASNEGIRLGTTKFIEWSNVGRVVETPQDLWVYHRKIPALPLFNVPTKEVGTELLRRYLTLHGISTCAESSSRSPKSIQNLTLLLIVWNLVAVVAAFACWRVTHWDVRWIITGLFALSFAVQLLVEVRRGLSQLTKISPAIDRSSFRPALENPPPAASHLPHNSSSAPPIPEPWGNDQQK